MMIYNLKILVKYNNMGYAINMSNLERQKEQSGDVKQFWQNIKNNLKKFENENKEPTKKVK